jgi:AraC-like DNA-binding protein
MEADINTLYESDFYRILDFKCRCKSCGESKPEYSESFCISFVRKGNFLFNVFRHSLDSYNGCILVTKPGYERTVTHIHTVPDECSIFDFKPFFYEQLKEYTGHAKFFGNNDLHSTLVKINAETEFLHYEIMQLVLSGSCTKLQTDNLVLELVNTVMKNITDYEPNGRINDRMKKNHLVTIERAREYITRHFNRDISMMEIAENCYTSPFHFSRIFKRFSGYSPHQFLLGIRLKHAEMLLKNSGLPIADVAYTSGFNSIEHFTTAFRQKYHYPPARFRMERNFAG